MKKMQWLAVTALFAANSVLAGGMEDDPFLAMVKIDQFEWQDADSGDVLSWDAQAWFGKDLRKLWVKTEGEYADGQTEEAEIQLLYSRAIAPYWDIQAGWRRDIRPTPDRDWFAVGFKGLAPYFFEVDAQLFFGESGRLGARFKAEYELMFTQRLILSPEVELNWYSGDDPDTGIGGGLSDASAGLRLRYEIRREFAPYIGVEWARQFGTTADFTEEEGGDISDTRLVAGIRAWF